MAALALGAARALSAARRVRLPPVARLVPVAWLGTEAGDGSSGDDDSGGRPRARRRADEGRLARFEDDRPQRYGGSRMRPEDHPDFKDLAPLRQEERALFEAIVEYEAADEELDGVPQLAGPEDGPEGPDAEEEEGSQIKIQSGQRDGEDGLDSDDDDSDDFHDAQEEKRRHIFRNVKRSLSQRVRHLLDREDLDAESLAEREGMLDEMAINELEEDRVKAMLRRRGKLVSDDELTETDEDEDGEDEGETTDEENEELFDPISHLRVRQDDLDNLEEMELLGIDPDDEQGVERQTGRKSEASGASASDASNDEREEAGDEGDLMYDDDEDADEDEPLFEDGSDNDIEPEDDPTVEQRDWNEYPIFNTMDNDSDNDFMSSFTVMATPAISGGVTMTIGLKTKAAEVFREMSKYGVVRNIEIRSGNVDKKKPLYPDFRFAQVTFEHDGSTQEVISEVNGKPLFGLEKVMVKELPYHSSPKMWHEVLMRDVHEAVDDFHESIIDNNYIIPPKPGIWYRTDVRVAKTFSAEQQVDLYRFCQRYPHYPLELLAYVYECNVRYIIGAVRLGGLQVQREIKGTIAPKDYVELMETVGMMHFYTPNVKRAEEVGLTRINTVDEARKPFFYDGNASSDDDIDHMLFNLEEMDSEEEIEAELNALARASMAKHAEGVRSGDYEAVGRSFEYDIKPVQTDDEAAAAADARTTETATADKPLDKPAAGKAASGKAGRRAAKQQQQQQQQQALEASGEDLEQELDAEQDPFHAAALNDDQIETIEGGDYEQPSVIGLTEDQEHLDPLLENGWQRPRRANYADWGRGMDTMLKHMQQTEALRAPGPVVSVEKELAVRRDFVFTHFNKKTGDKQIYVRQKDGTLRKMTDFQVKVQMAPRRARPWRRMLQ